MENINEILSELLITYSRSKAEIESILRIYEDNIKHKISLISINNIEESEKVIKELFEIQSEISMIVYKYNFPVSDFLGDFIYDFDRQDVESIHYIIKNISSN